MVRSIRNYDCAYCYSDSKRRIAASTNADTVINLTYDLVAVAGLCCVSSLLPKPCHRTPIFNCNGTILNETTLDK